MKKLLIIITVLFLGCTQEVVEPEKEERVCVFRSRPPIVDRACAITKDCPPRTVFVKCIEKWEAYRYSGKDNQVVREDCDQCQ